jgi:arylsulfatase
MYNTSKCWTTRISLLSGLFHNRSGRGFEHTSMVSEVLRPAGYKLWWSGKHHASFNPHERGFHHFSGFLGGAINFWNPDGKTARDGEPVPGWGANYNWAFDDKIVEDYMPDKSFYATDTFTDWALQWLEVAKDDSDPFFLFVAYNAPHWPLHAHQKDIDKYKGVYDKGYADIRNSRWERQQKMGLWAENVKRSEPDFGEAEWNALSDKAKYNEAKRMEVHAAMVDNVDQNVGRLIKSLKQQEKFDNTLIMFMVDNGASAEGKAMRDQGGGPDHPWGTVGTFDKIARDWALSVNSPLRYWKSTSHEGGICTPMIAHWPKGITAKGSINTTPCHLVDLLPTWMELAGDKANYPGDSKQSAIPPIDGVSIARTFNGETLKREKPMFFQYGSGRAVRHGDWKLVRMKSADWELYNISTDRTEMNNLAAEQPERVAAMTKLFDSWAAETSGSYVVKQAASKNKKKKKPKAEK